MHHACHKMPTAVSHSSQNYCDAIRAKRAPWLVSRLGTGCLAFGTNNGCEYSSATKIIRAGLGPPDLNCISQTFALQLRAAAIACALRIASDLIHTYCELETNDTLVHQRGTTA